MKSKKLIISTMVFGMAVTGSAGVYAGTNLQKISAYLNHSIGFKLNGAAYTPVDAKGNQLAPITYNNTTYLPIRSVADALKVPVTFNQATNQVLIGTASNGNGNGDAAITLSPVQYTAAQKQAIAAAFSSFDGFTTAYAPNQMVKGDAFQKVAASDDGVSFLFDHMRVGISPRDYSGGYESQAVKLSNGTQAKWYSPSGDTQILGFQLDDRFVSITSPDKSLSKAQMEKVAVSIAKLAK